MEARLVIEKGKYAGKVLVLGASVVIIGRSSKCELSLKGSSGVSRRHCSVRLVSGRYVVIDIESRNGTVLNGQTVARKFLEDGDLLQIGDEHVRFIARPSRARPQDGGRGDHRMAIGVPPELASDESVPPLPPGRDDGGSEQRTMPRAAIPQPKTRSDNDGSQTAPLRPERTEAFIADAALLARGRFDADRPTRDRDRPAQLAERAAPALSPKRAGSFGLRTLLLVAVLVTAALAIGAWDLSTSEPRLIAWSQTRAPALAAQLARARVALTSLFGIAKDDDARLADRRARELSVSKDIIDADAVALALPVDAGAMASTRPVDAGPVSSAPPVDASAVAREFPLDAGLVASANVGDLGIAVVLVNAASGGRIAQLRVAIGAVVVKGQTLAVLQAAGGLRKKLDSLREEERAFEQALQKGNKAARRDLQAVREAIAELTPRVRGTPLLSDVAGTVVEVFAKPGETIDRGQPIVSISP